MSKELLAHAAELLEPAGSVRTRRMFGGYGLYVDDLFIAIVAGDRLYLKTDDETRPAFAGAGGACFSFESRGKLQATSYWTVPAEAMESPAEMLPWARRAMAAAVRARARVSAGRRAPKRGR
jgi:DNA transformation protein